MLILVFWIKNYILHSINHLKNETCRCQLSTTIKYLFIKILLYFANKMFCLQLVVPSSITKIYPSQGNKLTCHYHWPMILFLRNVLLCWPVLPNFFQLKTHFFENIFVAHYKILAKQQYFSHEKNKTDANF